MKTKLRKTKIVGTIGPASEHKLKELFEAGLNVTRINYSHGSWDEQSEKTEEVLRLRKEMEMMGKTNMLKQELCLQENILRKL